MYAKRTSQLQTEEECLCLSYVRNPRSSHTFHSSNNDESKRVKQDNTKTDIKPISFVSHTANYDAQTYINAHNFDTHSTIFYAQQLGFLMHKQLILMHKITVLMNKITVLMNKITVLTNKITVLTNKITVLTNKITVFYEQNHSSDAQTIGFDEQNHSSNEQSRRALYIRFFQKYANNSPKIRPCRFFPLLSETISALDFSPSNSSCSFLFLT